MSRFELFRDKLGLDQSKNYEAVCACLQQQFAPAGNELKWQFIDPEPGTKSRRISF